MMVYSLIVVSIYPSSAIDTADNFGVGDAQGYKDTNVVVPVTITNVQNGPIISIIFDICYDHGVIEVVGVQKGDLTSSWDEPTFNSAFVWGARVSLTYDGEAANGLQNRATGSVVLLNLRVVGEPGQTSRMNLTNIQFSDATYKVGTASAKNGTFSILTKSDTDTLILRDTVEDVDASNAYWDDDGLWHITERRSNSASHSWWYGQEATGTYNTGNANSECLVSKLVDLSDATDATLKFWTYWQTESSTSTRWDKKLVEISTDGGATWSLLQQLSGSMQGDQVLSLKDYAGKQILIRFRFDTGDRYYNNFEGWFIDDITIEK
jgi:hypothetical protein